MRPEKTAILKEITDRLQGAEFVFLLNYGGLTVTDLTELRQAIQPLGGRALVAKNTLLGKAVQQLGWQDLSSALTGPTAVITGTGDVTELAKVLMGFVKKHDKASVKGGSLDTAALSADDVDALSKLPSRDAMRATLLGTLSAPATQMVRVLQAPLLNLLYVLKAQEEKKGGPEAA